MSGDDSKKGNENPEKRLDIDDFLLESQKETTGIRLAKNRNVVTVRGIPTKTIKVVNRKYVYVVLVVSAALGVFYLFGTPEQKIIEDESFGKLDVVKSETAEAAGEEASQESPSEPKGRLGKTLRKTPVSTLVKSRRNLPAFREREQRKADEVYEGDCLREEEEEKPVSRRKTRLSETRRPTKTPARSRRTTTEAEGDYADYPDEETASEDESQGGGEVEDADSASDDY